MTDIAPVISPELRRRNLALGLILAAISLATMTASIIIFTRSGLPKDPKEWKRLQQVQSSNPGQTPPQSAPLPGDKESTR